MQTLKLCLLFIALWVASVSQLQAQIEKFGKIDKESLSMEVYEKDSSAAAVVLFDVGKTYISYNTGKGDFEMIFERHRRIKILNKDGYDYADFRIPTYNPGSSNESLSGLKGYTYTLENGKIQKTKLEKSDIFNDDLNDDWRVTTFTMPNISEGCVIEFTYKINSDFITFLKEWEFQEAIPVVYSEYSVDIPEYFHYQKVNQGYLNLTLKEKTTKNGTVSFVSTSRGDIRGGGGSMSSQTVNYTINSETWAIEHAPALKEEEYITTMDDYVTKINYQLAGTQFPGSMYKNVLGSWEKINEILLQHENFGKQLGKGNYLKEVVANIQSKTNKPEEQIVLAYEFIRNHMDWNGESEMLTSDNLKKSFENKKGNSADVNLLLVSLLEELGANTQPIVLSTRDNGKINMAMPMIQSFNYVIAGVKLGEQYILLDATNKYLKPGMLPYRCLNWKGRIINEQLGNWIDLTPIAAAEATVTSFLKLGEDGSINGDVVYANKDYLSATSRSTINAKGVDKYLEKHKEDFGQDFIITEQEIKNLDKPYKSLDVKLSIESVEGGMGNMVYLSPLVVKLFDENPFKQENRFYPVDFGLPLKEKMMTTIILPEGFIVDELPESSAVSLPDNAGLFSFQVVNNVNSIQVLCTFSLNKTLFLPEEYNNLKKFFNYVLAKQEEQIVIKRKS